MGTNLKWTKIGYERFQEICIPLSSVLYPGRIFKLYLKPGHRQHGIDLKSLQLAGHPEIFIQCKNEKDFNTQSKIEEAIQQFTDGIFCKPGAHFSILTSADQQKQKLQEWLEREKQRLKKENDVTFECWDVHDLEGQLKDEWRLVLEYFSRTEAENYCLARFELNILDRLKPVGDIIPRSVVERPKSGSRHKLTIEEIFWSLHTAPKLALQTIFETNTNIYQYCVLGDAYQGKSTYLAQTAYEMAHGKAKLLPLVIELKSENVGSIETVLDNAIGEGWRDIANKDLVLILDAVDEVADEKITTMAKFIGAFSRAFPKTKMIVSCRTRHFKDFNIDETLANFRTLDLSQLESDQIMAYLRRQLTTEITSFNDQAARSGLNSWLFHPFYLNTLIAEFKQTRKLPASPLEAIKKFLAHAFEKAGSREIAAGELLKHKLAQFEQVIKRFAMALQLEGKNAFSAKELDKYFPQTAEKELIRNNPLITEANGQLSFTNSFLQEHLAASVLASMEFAEITKWVWADATHKKIKTKWIQTLSSAISLLPKTNPLRQEIIKLLEDDSPELIFETDASSHPPEFRFEALQKLIAYMLANNMWPLRVWPEKIGRFVDGSDQAGRFIIDLFLNPTTPNDKKVFCCRLLQSISLTPAEKKEILAIAIDYLKKSPNKDIAIELVKILSIHKIGDKTAVSSVIAITDMNENHFFRYQVYEWISRIGLTTDFWNYGLAGLPIWIDANTKQAHGGSDISLAAFLLDFTTIEQAATLFEALGAKKILRSRKFGSNQDHTFYSQLFENCADLHTHGATEILTPISRFLVAVGRNYQREEYPEIDKFIENTGTRSAIARLVQDDILVEEIWLPGPIIPEELIEEYLEAYIAKGVRPRALRNVGYALYPANDGALKRAFAIRANALAGEEVLGVLDPAQEEKYWLAQRKHSENNIRTIATRKAFRAAIRHYFKLRKKPLTDIHDLYETVDPGDPLYVARTPLIEKFIRSYFDHGKRPTLKMCLDDLNDDDAFERFRTEELMDHIPGEPTLHEDAEKIIRDFYDKKLPICQFENTYWTEDGNFHWKTLEHLVGQIFQKFDFPTDPKYLPELLWLDRIGVPEKHRITPGTEPSFFQKIENQLGGPDLAAPVLGRAIIDHLEKGIKLESVLYTHLSIAANLKLDAAVPFMLDALFNKKVESNKMEDLCKIYVATCGVKHDLLPLLQTTGPGEYYYLHLVRELGPLYPGDVKKACLEHLGNSKVDERVKAHLARELLALGSLDGLKFLSKYLRYKTEAVAMMQCDAQIAMLDTPSALDILFDAMDILVDPAYEVDRPPSPQHVLRSWLSALSEKSENDLRLVLQFIEKADVELQKRFPGPTELKWYAKLMLENSRKKADEGLDPAQVKKILHDLEPID